jgi:hypothetical protein
MGLHFLNMTFDTYCFDVLYFLFRCWELGMVSFNVESYEYHYLSMQYDVVFGLSSIL